jgi:hypothetical protein
VKDTAQVLPSGMSAGGMARLDRLVNELGYKSLTFEETKFGTVYVAEKKEQFRGSLYAPHWKVVWGSRDFGQELEFELYTSPIGRHKAALNAARGFLMDRNDVFKEV